MPSNILVNGLGLTFKGTVGISTATIPDVCKTPSPGGPVPIPYPNIATQSSLKNGTTTVKAKGKMIAVKGSQYGRSNGDEAGTAGGVKSSVNMKATDWITYSFDVKMDGKNACRHTDKKFHNNQNTVDLAGNADPVMPPGLSKEDRQLFKDCVKQYKKYDRLKKEEAKYKRRQIGNLRKVLRDNPRNAQAAQQLRDIMAAKAIRAQEVIDERKKYVKMGCDKFDYFQEGTSEQERRERHEGEIDHVQRQVNNLKNGG